MPAIAVFSGVFCQAEEVVKMTAEHLKLKVLPDAEVVNQAAQLTRTPVGKYQKILAGRVSAFNKFTHERERAIGELKMAMATLLGEEDLLIHGFCGLLVPREITHVLKVCLIADLEFRIDRAILDKGLTQKEATAAIHREDENAAQWTTSLFDQTPWSPELFDLLIPMDKSSVAIAAALIAENALKEVLRPSPASRQAIADFKLAGQVEVALAAKGHDVGVTARDGQVTLTINKHVLMLSRLENELKRLAAAVPGVKDVETKVGPGFYQADIYRQANFEIPSRVLLVDDEQEFVQTLSERLMMRDMGTTVVYDGEQALSFVRDEEPDVMVLDLKMPGIDGIEVLRCIKRDHPNIEVIILTGHGTKEDEQICIDLGAFAYLHKPVDIDILSKTMQEAYRKIRLLRRTIEE